MNVKQIIVRFFSLLCAVVMVLACRPDTPAVVAVTAISLTPGSLTLTEGESMSLHAEVSPENADNKKVLWTSDNLSVASVEDGIVTAMSMGRAVITAKSDDGGKKAYCDVTVYPKDVKAGYVSLDQSDMMVCKGCEYTFRSSIGPWYAENLPITWSSSDETIATVDENGHMVAISEGVVVISAYATGAVGQCKVSVIPIPLTFVSEGASSIRLADGSDEVNLRYSNDGVKWKDYLSRQTINLSDGEKVYFIANGSNTGMRENHFVMTGKIHASGNIMSLLDETMKRTDVPNNGFSYLFRDCTSLVSAPELPATTVKDFGYRRIFLGCENLESAPELPATALGTECYSGMFEGCTSLKSAPELPAEDLSLSCYVLMFSGCTSLETAPQLPSTKITYECYAYMFAGCSSLRSAPSLPAVVCPSSCYMAMFKDCTSLTDVPSLPPSVLYDFCCYEMFSGCTSLEVAPVLPATKLTWESLGCYAYMFKGCSKLNYVKALFTSKEDDSIYGWLDGTASEGVFVKNREATWTAEDLGIPEGWIIVDSE